MSGRDTYKCYYCGDLHNVDDECRIDLEIESHPNVTPDEARAILMRQVFEEDQLQSAPCENCGANIKATTDQGELADIYCQVCIDQGLV